MIMQCYREIAIRFGFAASEERVNDIVRTEAINTNY